MLNGSCAATQCTQAVDVGFKGEAETLNIPVAMGQTYFLVVDVYSDPASTQTGDFTISVH